MHYDYGNMPELSRDGIKNAQGKFLTLGLFYETANSESNTPPLWTLGETEVYHEASKKWLPSAYMTYLACNSEYEAMRRIVGCVRQWEMLKKLAWFSEALGDWRYEQAEKQKAQAKQVLMDQIAEGNLQSAKALFALLDKEASPGPGRPKKKDDKKDEGEDINNDLARIIPIRG